MLSKILMDMILPSTLDEDVTTVHPDPQSAIRRATRGRRLTNEIHPALLNLISGMEIVIQELTLADPSTILGCLIAVVNQESSMMWPPPTSNAGYFGSFQINRKHIPLLEAKYDFVFDESEEAYHLTLAAAYFMDLHAYVNNIWPPSDDEGTKAKFIIFNDYIDFSSMSPADFLLFKLLYGHRAGTDLVIASTTIQNVFGDVVIRCPDRWLTPLTVGLIREEVKG